jgi:hypothetical protein
LAKKNLIFLEIKNIQNKPKGCLPNTPLNQNNLNKKQQTKQGLMIDLVWTWLVWLEWTALTRGWPDWGWPDWGWPDRVNSKTNQNKDPKQIQQK